MKPSVKTHIEIRLSCNRAIRTMDALGYFFNRRTGRPRIYIQPNGDSSVGYAYARCVGERNGRGYYALSVIMNPGGGVVTISGSHTSGDMIDLLRNLLADPEQMKLHQYKPKEQP